MKKPNHYDFFNIRRQSVAVPHFEYVNIPVRYNIEQSISKWITTNLKGRFYIGKSVLVNNHGDIDTVLKIGFEDHKECSYFTLACPHLKYN